MKSISVLLRDQSVFITRGGSEEFRGVHSNFGCQRGVGGYSLEDFVEGGSKNTYCPVEFAIHISNFS